MNNIEHMESLPSGEGKYELRLPVAAQLLAQYNMDAPTQVHRLTGGMINDIFAIDGKVLKVMSGNPELGGRMEKEAGLYRILAAQGIPVPHVYGIDTSHSLIPYDYLLMEQVPGSSLGSIWPSLGSEERLSYLEKLGHLLAEINTIPFPQFGEDFKDGAFAGPDSASVYFEENIKKIVASLRTSHVLEDEMIIQIEHYFMSNDLFKKDFPASLLHGNFNHNNVLADQGEIKGIVDWEFARTGHSEEDIAIYLYRELHLGQQTMSKFREGYESVLPLDNQFGERMYAHNLLYYLRVLPYASSWTHRPDKQKEYLDETEKLFQLIAL